MKNFLLIRHAKSSWSKIGLSDKDRPLNDRGKRDGPYMAAYCRQLGFEIDTLISSPAKRAHKTAKYFKKEFDVETGDIVIESDLYFGSESDCMYVINELSEKIKLPAIFFHNPTITIFANSFAKEFLDNVPTCGVVHIRSAATTWKEVGTHNSVLTNYYFPKLVRKE